MARQSQGGEAWPTVLWVAWMAGGAERCAPLCRAHRAEVFERYPETARGQGRRGDRCSACAGQPPGSALR
jgi:hypothetical protein